MTKARIYSKSNNVMQSAPGKDAGWVLEYKSKTAKIPNSLMGWTSAGDTLGQVKLQFDTRNDAIAYADRHGLSYMILADRTRKVKPRNFGDNFKYLAEEN